MAGLDPAIAFAEWPLKEKLALLCGDAQEGERAAV
jgi:hypothetical protein